MSELYITGLPYFFTFYDKSPNIVLGAEVLLGDGKARFFESSSGGG
jgi:hypothetical protein